jgi:outer membrane protein assembly factor BamB
MSEGFRAYVTFTNSSEEGMLYALNPDGTLKWSYRLSGLSSDVPVIDRKGTIYVIADNLLALNPDGTLKWSVTVSWGRRLVVGENVLYLCTSKGLYAMGNVKVQKFPSLGVVVVILAAAGGYISWRIFR